MKQQLERRLRELRAEYESGQKMLADLEAQQVEVQKTVLRISGAIQVLEEELAKATQTAANDLEPPEGTEEAGPATEE